jgi:putative endonuclease
MENRSTGLINSQFAGCQFTIPGSRFSIRFFLGTSAQLAPSVRAGLLSEAMPDERQLLGAEGERAAEKFLRRQRYAIVQRNYRCRSGEVDLIALDGSAVVFVEVKTRTQPGFGNPLEAVDRRKQRQIVRAAQHYLAENRLHDRDARFDVVGVWWEDGRVQCELVKGAFDAK